MLVRWHLLSSCLVMIWLCPSRAMCPVECICRLDENGKKRVSCMHGGMLDPIPTFQMDSNLEILEISAPKDNWNSLSLGPIFQNFKYLEELHVTRSGIAQIGMHAFWGVPSIRVLNVTFNNISVVFDHNFRGLVNLVELNLDDNRISRLPSGAFKHLSELRILTMQRNRLDDLVPRLFVKLAKLHVLKISDNPIQDLNPEVFKDIPDLRVFECRSCGIRRVNAQIYHLLPYLTHLDLGNNVLQFLDNDEFVDLHRLRVLRLDGNQLPVVLERTFANQVFLRSLHLARNRLAKITNTAFLNLTSLNELDISYNKMSKLDAEVFAPLVGSLQKLQLSGNYFSFGTIKLILKETVNVRELALANMRLADVPESFLPPGLLHLNISGNNLTSLNTSVLPSQLLSLDMSRNKFLQLDEALLARLELIKSLKLEENPWMCSRCHVETMFHWINKSSFVKNVECASPDKLKGRLFSTLTMDELPPCSVKVPESVSFASKVKEHVGVVIGGISLVVFLIACVLYVVFSCVRAQRNRREAVEKEKGKNRREATLEDAVAIFDSSKGQISFKFPLDLPERKVSVSTIDNMKKDSYLHTLPNGTGI